VGGSEKSWFFFCAVRHCSATAAQTGYRSAMCLRTWSRAKCIVEPNRSRHRNLSKRDGGTISAVVPTIDFNRRFTACQYASMSFAHTPGTGSSEIEAVIHRLMHVPTATAYAHSSDQMIVRGTTSPCTIGIIVAAS